MDGYVGIDVSKDGLDGLLIHGEQRGTTLHEHINRVRQTGRLAKTAIAAEQNPYLLGSHRAVWGSAG